MKKKCSKKGQSELRLIFNTQLSSMRCDARLKRKQSKCFHTWCHSKHLTNVENATKYRNRKLLQKYCYYQRDRETQRDRKRIWERGRAGDADNWFGMQSGRQKDLLHYYYPHRSYNNRMRTRRGKWNWNCLGHETETETEAQLERNKTQLISLCNKTFQHKN